MPGKAFLEKLIIEYPGAVVIISHDRYLLDACITHIAEIEDGRITTFIGNYTEYIIDKEERLARQEELYQVQQREIGRLDANFAPNLRPVPLMHSAKPSPKIAG